MLKLYSKPNCAPCISLKGFFNRLKIDYEEIEVGSPDFALMLNKTGYRTVPVVELDGDFMLGTNPRLFSELKKRGYYAKNSDREVV